MNTVRPGISHTDKQPYHGFSRRTIQKLPLEPSQADIAISHAMAWGVGVCLKAINMRIFLESLYSRWHNLLD